MHERVKVAFCCSFHITPKIKLMFLLRLLLIFSFHEEMQSSEVVNKLKESSLFFLLCPGFGIHSETMTFNQTNYTGYHTDLTTISSCISLWPSQFLHKLDFLLDLTILWTEHKMQQCFFQNWQVFLWVAQYKAMNCSSIVFSFSSE